MTISGFMILKNAVSQGYPFLEAVVAALPICDEFLVSDGYSSDETWAALQELKKAFPDQIKLFRDEWSGRTPKRHIFALMTDVLRQRCRGEYCLDVQGNEVLHESSLDEMRQLPLLYPEVEIFRLPFYNILGDRLLWLVNFRRRLFKNKKYIVARGDAYDVGYDPRSLLWRPRKLIRYVLHGTGEWVYYLPQPFFRYRALCPANYMKKLESRIDLKGGTAYLWRKEYEYARAVWQETADRGQSPEVFWQHMREYFDQVMWEGLPPGVAPARSIPRRCIGELVESPRIMQHLLDKWEYELQDSLAMLRAAGDGG